MIKLDKNIEHEREDNSVEIEENILNRVWIFMCRPKVYLFPHSNSISRAPYGFLLDGFPCYMLCICVNVEYLRQVPIYCANV